PTHPSLLPFPYTTLFRSAAAGKRTSVCLGRSINLPSCRLQMRLAGHRAFQFSIFIAMLITPIQLGFDRIDLLLLVGFAFAFVVKDRKSTRLNSSHLGISY